LSKDLRTDFDTTSYRLELTLQLFRNNTLVPLFLFRVKTENSALTFRDFVRGLELLTLFKNLGIFSGLSEEYENV